MSIQSMPHFHTAYWINLSDRPDKAEFFSRSFPALHPHPVQRWEGFHPWNLSIITRPKPGHSLGTTGQLGCYLSHLTLWRHIAFLKEDAAVFEDDAIIRTNFLELLNEQMPSIAPDWEFIHLGGPDPDRTYMGGTWAYLIRWQTAARLSVEMMTRNDTTDQSLIKRAHAGALRFIQFPIALVANGDQQVHSDGSCRDDDGNLTRPVAADVSRL